jgi:hypothetical protein
MLKVINNKYPVVVQTAAREGDLQPIHVFRQEGCGVVGNVIVTTIPVERTPLWLYEEIQESLGMFSDYILKNVNDKIVHCFGSRTVTAAIVAALEGGVL